MDMVYKMWIWELGYGHGNQMGSRGSHYIVYHYLLVYRCRGTLAHWVHTMYKVVVQIDVYYEY